MGKEQLVVHKSVQTSGKKKDKESFVVNRLDSFDGLLRFFFSISLVIHDLDSGKRFDRY